MTILLCRSNGTLEKKELQCASVVGVVGAVAERDGGLLAFRTRRWRNARKSGGSVLVRFGLRG